MTRGWERNPMFYVDQTLGAYVQLLLDPSAFTADRTRDLVATLRSIPVNLENGKKNLAHPVGPFARLAIEQLNQADTTLRKSVEELKPRLVTTAQEALMRPPATP